MYESATGTGLGGKELKKDLEGLAFERYADSR